MAGAPQPSGHYLLRRLHADAAPEHLGGRRPFTYPALPVRASRLLPSAEWPSARVSVIVSRSATLAGRYGWT